MISSAWPKTSFAESTPEWNDRLRGAGWSEVTVFAKSVRLWKNKKPEQPGLTRYAIQVFAGKKCRAVEIVPHLNKWARSAFPVGPRFYRTNFHRIGFLAPKANTPHAERLAELRTITATVSEIQECPGEHIKTNLENPRFPFGG